MQFDDSTSAVHQRVVVHNVLAFMLSILIDQVCFACTNVLQKCFLPGKTTHFVNFVMSAKVVSLL